MAAVCDRTPGAAVGSVTGDKDVIRRAADIALNVV